MLLSNFRMMFGSPTVFMLLFSLIHIIKDAAGVLVKKVGSVLLGSQTWFPPEVMPQSLYLPSLLHIRGLPESP